MNTLEITLLSLNFVLTIAGLEYCIRHFAIRNREVDKSIKSLKEKVFELESMLRYDLQFELSEIKNKQELLEVKVSKVTFDFSELKFHILTKQQAETLAKNVMKSIAESKSSSKEEENDDLVKKETKPSESVQNEVVDLIRKDNKERITLKRKVGHKKVKTNIKKEDIEIAFIDKYNMTFYGYRLKFGEEAFKKAKYHAYQRAYYVNVKKQKLITK
jgi:hypothetical protein